MTVTAIRVQVKHTGRYSVYVDGAYGFSLSADSLLASGLTQGQELSQDELTAYKRLSQDDKAYALTLAYIARRMRSRGELHDYFRRKQYSQELCQYIEDRLERTGLIDDAEFARRWVDNRRRLRATSTKRLRQELQQKKISEDVIRIVLAQDETDETQLLRDLIAKKRRIARYRDDQKLTAYLMRQGFAYGDIKGAL